MKKVIIGRPVSSILVGKPAYIFSEGQVIATSPVEEAVTLNPGAFEIKTRNSKYYLIVSGPAVPAFAIEQVKAVEKQRSIQ